MTCYHSSQSHFKSPPEVGCTEASNFCVRPTEGEIMRYSYKHKVNYINWKEESKQINITKAEMQDKIDKLKDEFGDECETKTNRYIFTYRTDRRGYYKYLYTYENKQYIVYTCNTYNDAANDGTTSITSDKIGTKSQRAENKLFEELNGVSERFAFGYCNRELIHYCIPKQLYHINGLYINKELHNISKADYSSHYPDCMQGKLPDWKKHKELKGRIEPTEEYPFAFYINGHMCAEYGRFDMHNWKYHILSHDLFREDDLKLNIPDDEEITILCKASKYELTSTEQKLYEYKLRGEMIEGITAKEVLNSAIGYKHLSNLKSNKCKLDHVAAITIARANQQMIDLIDELGYRNVLQVVVDGIIYKGKNEIGVREKYLGALVQENTNCDFIMRGINQYMFFKDGEYVDSCHGAFDTDIETNELTDIYKWRRSNGK